MNTNVVIAAEGEPDAVSEGMHVARRFIEENAARMTRFSDSSELMRLNRAAGTRFEASAELFDVVQQAVAYAGQTGGIFDPTLLDVLEAAGYDRSMDDIRVNGAGPQRAALPAGKDWHEIELDEPSQTIRLPIGVRLDLGGIAKGWIAEGAAHMLAGFATACAVNAGGDMFAIGVPANESMWEVALEDPRDSQSSLAVLRLGPGAVATSAITKRRWQQGDHWQHHLIDPRRRAPAQTDWLSVTAITAHATMSEVFAKALLIAGSQESASLTASHPDLIFIAVDEDGRLWGSAGAGDLLAGGQSHA